MLKMNREMRGDTEGRENYADRYKRNLKKGKTLRRLQMSARRRKKSNNCKVKA